MTKSELAKKLAEKTKFTPEKAEKLIEKFGKIITDQLADGKKVVYSNFGTFYTVHYPSKVIYHPVLGAKKKMVMLPTDVVKWMPSGNIKEMVDLGKDVESATSFGATKKFKETKAEEGIVDKKATEISEIEIGFKQKDTAAESVEPTPLELEEEEVEIPIRKINKQIIDEKNSNEPEEKEGNNFWNQLFNKESDETETIDAEKVAAKNTTDDKVSLIGAGIFDNAAKNNSIENQPQAKKNDSKSEISDTKKAELPETLSPFTSKKTIAYIDLSNTAIPKEILQKIPEKVAREYQVVPIEETDKDFTVGMVDPEDIDAIETIKRIVQKPVIAKLTTKDDIAHILDQYQGFEGEMEEALDQAEKDEDKTDNTEDNKKLLRSIGDLAPAARIVSSLLKRAIRDKSSDIHVEPYDNEVVIRFRIDGVLHKKISLPKEIQQAVISRIKILSNLKIDEQRLPQDGRFSINMDGRRIDFRVSTMPIANGEKVVMRVLDKLSGIIGINDLGFRERDLKEISNACEKTHGMILVTGPTGSGKTTTLYALIEKIYAEGINIITLEDPIEYQMPGINQSQVNAEINYTFASGLRSILRQDPDVVMIGEIRDKETAEMAVHAALTGHVVLSTLHTNDSAGAIPRLIDMGVEPFLINSSLNLIIGQRLARKICDNCKEEAVISKDQLESVKAELDKMPKAERERVKKTPLKFFKGKGCKSCNDTGYKGRIGLYEILAVDNSVKALIEKRSSSDEIKTASINSGMTTMIQDGILKAIGAMTTIEEVWRVTKE